MPDISFSDEIRAAAPGLRVLIAEASVRNSDTTDELWQEIASACSEIGRMPMEAVNKRPAIAATRAAYKALGKDPNRYRPSAEALSRRAVKGMDLYRTTAIVDLINLLSLRSGHSIGAFDADAIDGDSICLGRGCEGEPYEAIGRGLLNIAGLPVWRDATGGFGTPTSDNERTKLSGSTCRLLVTANMYGTSEMSDSEFEAELCRLLTQYAAATDIKTAYHTPVAL
ncbi:MAG: hypothetical protein K2F77_04290 [Muribaculaceae bacterium]|nr:hypothetical protein [Muribaculaceae bacterium]